MLLPYRSDFATSAPVSGMSSIVFTVLIPFIQSCQTMKRKSKDVENYAIFSWVFECQVHCLRLNFNKSYVSVSSGSLMLKCFAQLDIHHLLILFWVTKTSSRNTSYMYCIETSHKYGILSFLCICRRDFHDSVQETFGYVSRIRS